MSVIIRDDGFHEAEVVDYDGQSLIWIEPESYDSEMNFSHAKLIAVHFASFSDGRGFGIARELRGRGFDGTLRASGYVISDQYAMARRVGFDEVEISDELAARQDAAQWQYRADWKAFDYQSRLGQRMGAKNE